VVEAEVVEVVAEALENSCWRFRTKRLRYSCR
jgi:hypothetical protein